MSEGKAFQQCRVCLYDNRHPFGLTFDDSGLCSGCSTHAEKTSLDWSARFGQLERLVAPYRGRKGNYDCVIPIRGTAEYFKVLDVVKNQLGMNPLLVAFNSHFNSQAGIENTDLIRDTFDCDIFLKTMSPLTYKKLIRETLSRFGSVHWPWLAGQSVWPVRVAVQHDIPLIIWPFHQPTEQAGMFSYLDENGMTRRGRHEHDLLGHEPDELVSAESLLSEHDVLALRYPSDSQLEETRLRGIYLSNYLPWDTRAYSEQMVERFGARASECPGTMDTYDHVDNLVYMSVHDRIKQRKLGYGRVRDHLCREIRFGRISREQALRIEAAMAGQGSQRLEQMFFDWLGISEQAFEWLMNHHFGPRALHGEPVGELPQAFLDGYRRNRSALADEERFILIGKGLTV
jgi:N-acetyl sugar amidotransferase